MICNRKATVSAHLDGQRFDLAACDLFPDLSRKAIKEIIDTGGGYLNKRRITIAKTCVKTGQTLEVFWQPLDPQSDRPSSKKARWNTLDTTLRDSVVDEHTGFWVINKPAGIPSQGTLVDSTDTIIHALHYSNPDRFRLEQMHLVHRLDKDTSGLLLIAKTATWRGRLENIFRDRAIKKIYHAITLGIPSSETGTINAPIAKDRSRPNAYLAIMHGKHPAAKTAETHFRILQTFVQAQAALVECAPTTGRTHQIRVHLAAVGAPIAGDRTYGTGLPGHPCDQLALRQMLHASRLSIDLDSSTHNWEAPFPADFSQCLEAVGQINKEE